MDRSEETLERIVLEELDRCREKVIERIARTRKLTDEEVYHAGVALGRVVEEAQAFMKSVHDRMSASMGASPEVGSTLDTIQSIAERQRGEVSSALEHLADIAKAGQRIRELSSASRLLALNARVESARFGGEGGRAFNVIADEMRELSVSVESTNTLVGKLARQLQESLPKIQDQSRAMGDEVSALVTDLGKQNQTLQEVVEASSKAGAEALDAILAQARVGLGHLQFQDTMIQDLEGIERVLKKAHEAVARALSASLCGGADAFLGTLGAELEDEREPETEIEAGDVLLF